MKLLKAIVIAGALGLILTAPSNASLIINGSFETPDVSPGIDNAPTGGWGVFSSIPGWTATTGNGLEIQDHVIGANNEAWLSYDGDQLAEMDVYANSGMFQTVTTISGQEYNLSFAYSPRPALVLPSSGVELYINDVLIDTIWTNGVGLWNTVWAIGTYKFTATGTSSTIKFMATGISDGMGTLIDDVQLTLAVPELSCEGFEPPMDNGPVTVRKNKGGKELPPAAPGTLVLPLNAELSDSGVPITDAFIAAPPVLQVLFDSGVGAAVDVTDDALPAGHATSGNQFVFTAEEKWQFNLGTWNYTAPGTYTISVASGDETEYVISPTCTATFVVE
jgi:hypothetical protein